MAGPLTAFVDHYAIVGVDPKADPDTIRKAFAAASAKYHPLNGTAPDTKKMEEIKASFEVLIDPVARKAYDAVKLGPQDDELPEFTPEDMVAALEDDIARRTCLMSLLYNKRRSTPARPGLAVRLVEQIMKITPPEILLTTWYLKSKGLISSDDKSNLIITVEGIDFLEAARPNPAAIRRMLREKPEPATSLDGPPIPAAAADPPPPPPPPAPPPPPPEKKPATAIPSSISRAIANLGQGVRNKL